MALHSGSCIPTSASEADGRMFPCRIQLECPYVGGRREAGVPVAKMNAKSAADFSSHSLYSSQNQAHRLRRSSMSIEGRPGTCRDSGGLQVCGGGRLRFPEG